MADGGQHDGVVARALAHRQAQGSGNAKRRHTTGPNGRDDVADQIHDDGRHGHMAAGDQQMTAPKIHAARTAIRPTFFFITNPTAMTAIRTTSEINAILLLTRMPPFSWFHPTWPCGVETLGQIATIEHSASAT